MLAISYLIHIYTDTENFSALQQLFNEIPQELRSRPELMAPTGRYYAARGEEAKARQIYQELTARFDSLTPVGMLYTAELAASLGEVEESLDMQEHLADSGSLLQFWSKLIYRNNQDIREHYRYEALLQRMGLDDESVAELHSRMSFD